MRLHRLTSICSILAALFVTFSSLTSCNSDKGKRAEYSESERVENTDEKESPETRAAASGLAIHEVRAMDEIDRSLIEQLTAAGAVIESSTGIYAHVPVGKVENVDKILKSAILPEEVLPAWSYSKNEFSGICDDGDFYDLYFLHRSPAITGADVASVSLEDDSHFGKIISARLSDEGATEFANITQKNIGRPLAIVLDEKVVSAPYVNTKITGGKFQITGYFDDIEKMYDNVTTPGTEKK